MDCSLKTVAGPSYVPCPQNIIQLKRADLPIECKIIKHGGHMLSFLSLRLKMSSHLILGAERTRKSFQILLRPLSCDSYPPFRSRLRSWLRSHLRLHFLLSKVSSLSFLPPASYLLKAMAILICCLEEDIRFIFQIIGDNFPIFLLPLFR